MVDPELLEEISIEDMPNNDMHLVAESCGVEVAVTIMQNLSGISLNVPKFGFKKIIDRHILGHYDGHNARELALQMDVTERYVYKILKNNKREKDEQLKLF